jgi:hypothetical protein
MKCVHAKGSRLFVARRMALVLVGAWSALACENESVQLNPTPDNAAPGGVYIPTDIPDAVNELDRMLPDDAKAKIAHTAPAIHHLSLGQWIRINWGLRDGSRLAVHLESTGITDPEDMSGVILTAYWLHLNNRTLSRDSLLQHWTTLPDVTLYERYDSSTARIP